ncbi:MAG: glutamate-1-semialdehyde 2,1-aminomutase [Phycisphaerae bacterium]
MNDAKSKKAFDLAVQFIPGGVNSPVRSFSSVGGTPRFIHQGKGCKITDIDENEYIDYVGSWGPLILGHADQTVLAAVAKTACRGLTFGAPTEGETLLAQMICRNFESIDLVRLVNSGTEAVTSILRLARGYTGKNKIIKAAGGYHGHVDQLLVQAGSGVATLGLPASAGIAANIAELTIVVPYNDLSAVEEAFAKYGQDICAVLIEPIAGNMGVIPPMEGYLQGLRKLCDQHKSLLIFDEVITGFRVSAGGAQQLYGVKPDLTVLGKIIGGGLPVGAYGGRREIMELLAPLGPVYQAGTLSGNPLATAAGIATLAVLEYPQAYAKLESLACALADGLGKAAWKAKVPLSINRVGSMMTPFFGEGPIRNYQDVQNTNRQRYNRFFHLMLDRGIYLPPSAFEAMFVSLAHTPTEIEYTVEQARISFEQLVRDV